MPNNNFSKIYIKICSFHLKKVGLRTLSVNFSHVLNRRKPHAISSTGTHTCQVFRNSPENSGEKWRFFSQIYVLFWNLLGTLCLNLTLVQSPCYEEAVKNRNWIDPMSIGPIQFQIHPNMIYIQVGHSSQQQCHMSVMTSHTSYVDGTPTSEVTTVTIRYICPPHYGHTSLYHGHEWMTHILFVPCQSAIPFLRYSYFRLWPWIFNSRVNVLGVVKGQGHTIGPVSYQFTSFSFHINQTNNSWDRAISKFYLATSKVKVMSEVKGQGHILYPVSNRCTSFSFHINQTKHSWDMAKIHIRNF